MHKVDLFSFIAGEVTSFLIVAVIFTVIFWPYIRRRK